jgi:hypothetical protein
MMRRGGLAMAALLAGVALSAAGPGAGARAQDAAAPSEPLSKTLENVSVARVPTIRDLAKKAGIAADPPPAADFVVNARPTGGLDYIPVGRLETEHPVKTKTAAELKAMEGDFDAVKTRHDAIRATFAPSVKAVAEAAAAKAAKAARPKGPRPTAVSVQ